MTFGHHTDYRPHHLLPLVEVGSQGHGLRRVVALRAERQQNGRGNSRLLAEIVITVIAFNGCVALNSKSQRPLTLYSQ